MSEQVISCGMAILFGGFAVTIIWKFAGLLLDGKDVQPGNPVASAALLVLNLAVAVVLSMAAWRLQGAMFAAWSLAWPQLIPAFYPPVAVVLLGMGAWHWREHRQQPSRRSLIFIILAALTALLPLCLFVLLMVTMASIKASGL